MKKSSVTQGFLWKTMEQYGVMGIQFILQLFLARILEPEVYGVVAIVIMFIAFSNVFIQKGFATALVQSKEISQEDISSVFYVSILIALFFYACIFVCAPSIARFFNMPELTWLLRVMCLTLFPGVYSSIQNALLRREINFKVVFFASTISVGVSGGVAIWMALNGAGVWSLAVQQLLHGFLVVFVQYYQCRWHPVLHCSLSKVKRFWAFGWKVLVTGLIDEIFVEMRTFIIGKFYTKLDLSFFSRGRQFPHLLMNSVNGSLQAVLLPRFSSIQNNKVQMSNVLISSITTSYFVLLPLLVLLACSAEPLITVLLSEKWLPCVPYLQLYCLYYAAWPFTTSSMQAIYAVGHSDVILKIEIIRKVLDVAVLLVSVRYDVFWIAAGAVAVEVITIPLYVQPARMFISYSIREQLKELFPTSFNSMLVGLVVIYLGMIPLASFSLLIVQCIAALFLYVTLAWLFQRNVFIALLERLRLMRKNIQ